MAFLNCAIRKRHHGRRPSQRIAAEIGVVATPCKGLPHPQYHEVAGVVASSDVPNGHIAAVDAPGFSLRGDRGDLFALRKAVVRIADNGDGEKTDKHRRGS